jgi:copper(I)-binding protein
MFKKLIILAVALSSSIVFAAVPVDKELATNVVTISNAYIKATPSGKHAAIFMDLKNTGKLPHALVAVDSSELSAQTQIHSTSSKAETHDQKHSLTHMEQVDKHPIAPGQTEKFEFGGHHIMLMGLTKPLKAGESYTIILHFADGSAKKLTVSVR